MCMQKKRLSTRKLSCSLLIALISSIGGCKDDSDASVPSKKADAKSEVPAAFNSSRPDSASIRSTEDSLESALHADLGIPPTVSPDPNLLGQNAEDKKVAAESYAQEWLRSRDVFVQRWARADYISLDSRDVCRSLVERIPRSDSAGLDQPRIDGLIEAVTSIVAMNSCTGYEEYKSFIVPRRATQSPEALARTLEWRGRELGRTVNDDEAMRSVWEDYVFKDGNGPWRALAVDHSEIATQRSTSSNISVREEILAIGTPSTAFSFAPIFHSYPRKPQDEVNENDHVLLATVRLLLRGQDSEKFGPMVLRFWWDSSTQLWVFDDEKLFLRNEGMVEMPYF